MASKEPATILEAPPSYTTSGFWQQIKLGEGRREWDALHENSKPEFLGNFT